MDCPVPHCRKVTFYFFRSQVTNFKKSTSRFPCDTVRRIQKKFTKQRKRSGLFRIHHVPIGPSQQGDCSSSTIPAAGCLTALQHYQTRNQAEARSTTNAVETKRCLLTPKNFRDTSFSKRVSNKGRQQTSIRRTSHSHSAWKKARDGISSSCAL